MNLNFKTQGQGTPLIILHGLFGTLDNWKSIANHLSSHFQVFILDQRNHGKSPHISNMDLSSMANDIVAFMDQMNLPNAHIMGHSMGGKVAMQFAFDYPERLNKLIVLDIAPRAYQPGHLEILAALRDLPIHSLKNRKEAEEKLFEKIKSTETVLFLLKNLSRNKLGGFEWKMNLPVITRDYIKLIDKIHAQLPHTGPVLFLKGNRSNYIREEDISGIKALFPITEIKTIQNAGHWIHAENPSDLLNHILHFL
ncbi:MAG: alpha/beta fold hydrolase [Saprospiraceae bacterium]